MEKIDTVPNGASRQIVMATLNVNGLYSFRKDPRTRSLLRPYPVRIRALGRLIEASDINVVNFQEVFTHRQRRLLSASLPSFGYSTYESSVTGPKGALVTFSRLPLQKEKYGSFYSVSRLADRSELPPLVLAKSSLKGTLVSRVSDSSLAIVNAHPLANYDWDWSPGNRFHSLEEMQLGKIASVVNDLETDGFEVALGADLNVAKSSALFRIFLGKAGLHDSFEDDQDPTFHAEFVTGGRSPECIDYVLVGDNIKTGKSYRLFENKVAVEGAGEIYLTDHQGLCTEFVA
jgi:hypothetical protein